MVKCRHEETVSAMPFTDTWVGGSTLRGEVRVNPGKSRDTRARADVMLRWTVAVIVVLFGALELPASAGAAEPNPEPRGVTTTVVGGSWLVFAPWPFTTFDPATGDFSCVGSTSWEGSWTGITHYDMGGNFTLVTPPSTAWRTPSAG
jgi:hypothetical protein